MMRKIFPLIVVLALMAGALMAAGKDVKLTGFLLDNNCTAGHENDKAFAKDSANHATSCAKMAACEKAGYAVYAAKKLYKLDDAGNALAAEVLKNTKAKKGVKVRVEGTVDGDMLKVTKLTEVAAK